MTVPPTGQSCLTCSNYYGSRCRYSPPDPLHGDWVGVDPTDWCACWGLTPASSDAIYVASRRILTSDTMLYVSTTGDDVNGAGTTGSPWATLQKAVDYTQKSIDLAGYTVTIRLTAGTTGTPAVYQGAVIRNMTGGGLLLIDTSDNNPLTTTIQEDVAGQGAIEVYGNSAVSIAGMTLASLQGPLIYMKDHAFLSLGTPDCNTITLGQTAATYYSQIIIVGYAAFTDNYRSGTVYPAITVAPANNIIAIVFATQYAKATLGSAYTITGSPTFSDGLLVAQYGAFVDNNSQQSGTAAGPKYLVKHSAIFISESGATYAGSTPGVVIDAEFIDGTNTSMNTVIAVSDLGTGIAGMKRLVNDATANTFASVVAGLGGNTVPVYYDGSDWRVG